MNVLSPGPTDTQLFGDGLTEEEKQAFARMAAQGRLGWWRAWRLVTIRKKGSRYPRDT
jgi:hypothetical protein